MKLQRIISKLLVLGAIVLSLGLFLNSSDVRASFSSVADDLQSNQIYWNFLGFLNGSGFTAPSGANSATLADVANNKLAPAVVSIYGSENITTALSRGQFFASASAGTGFIIDPNGYILTNNHVVNSPNFSYSVVLSGGQKLPATIVFTDPAKDLAILKISGANYPIVNLGDSSKIGVGQQVAGIGDAFGFAPGTISNGVVSGLNRSIIASDEQGDEQLSGLIRTTMQLYPGDSGGPLFDANGNVIGIDVATSTDQPNLSFSIPINMAKPEIENVLNHTQS